MNPYIVTPDLNGEGLHIGIVRARFNESIGLAELEACLKELEALGVDERDVTVLSVPGALELGITLGQMAETGEFDALIALGAVIRGDTYHFEVVSNESASAITQVSLATGIPVANGVLTTNTDEQAEVRAAEKGRDCARTAVELGNLIAVLEPELDDDEDEDYEDEDLDDDK
ncbi:MULTISPECIES: 6,7-dimethyl-8-ribityllumazine synthase [Alcaligenes]|jgi:6,7-dimethyl-8-ribityllumazine synthase|uniref:6,7-dimethyl-8-ribityllumazine synthase n=2 Tax=Alcaligenes TaxID=507 RepID=A0A3G2HXS3_9BURK|nr:MULTISPECIES: 6,7-dimethyl-8-ribityllumazine synthase [Alcaligenes]ASR90624.1 6,7-dimethyl-8-ribityllumazine synthase [Alcaligenes faecalis]AWG36708.1 6,7-dimethyl-8-ribityllumazine synthase [Alcaligenes aquatilis]AYN21863.1 6,7-dimethyl-8-ribityllumazine synthase [Alcaligenes aquatilis]MCC9164238.1 6,7-dimethyl-8-ribityllumazine synthase [Alcaligenes sp. MMA]MDV2118022.1 6,7-dimethyl-8-ribityllumazine synthase [Alcaligenes faecalis]